MLVVTIEVNAPAGQSIGIKEELAQHLERWGDCRVVAVRNVEPEQLTLGQERLGTR